MSRPDRRSVLALLGTAALSACTTAGPVGRTESELLGFAENDPFEGGIGGTGIVGILTGFGSLVVNGLRVEMTAATRIVSAFGPVSQDRLAPGMALSVVASRARDATVARRVAIDYALVGLARHGAGGRLRINGVPVRREPGAIGRVRDGERVAVSGLWSPAGLVASRFEPAPHDQDLIAGTAEHDGPTGLGVSGVPVRSSDAGIDAGQYAVVRGRYDMGTFDAASVSVGRFGGMPSLRQLSVEGYLEPIASAPDYRVSGLGHSFDRDLALRPLASSRAIYFGPYDGLFNASAGYVVPEDFARRRALLGRGFGDGFDGEVIRT